MPPGRGGGRPCGKRVYPFSWRLGALLPRVTGLLAVPGMPLADPRERGYTPGVAGRRSRWRTCGKYAHSGAQKGPQHGKGQTAAAAAGAPGPILCVVHPPRARRRRHSDLPGQGAGHVPCRVSGPVSRRDVAMGGALGTTVCASNHGACPQRCDGQRVSRQRHRNREAHTTDSLEHGATRCRSLSRSLMP